MPRRPPGTITATLAHLDEDRHDHQSHQAERECVQQPWHRDGPEVGVGRVLHAESRRDDDVFHEPEAERSRIHARDACCAPEDLGEGRAHQNWK